MYFVTTKNPGYVLFCMTPSERAAVGLTEKGLVRLLVRDGGTWRTAREWQVEDLSHTEYMVLLGDVAEPDDPAELTRYLPARLRG